jgi:hypothetical protein
MTTQALGVLQKSGASPRTPTSSVYRMSDPGLDADSWMRQGGGECCAAQLSWNLERYQPAAVDVAAPPFIRT